VSAICGIVFAGLDDYLADALPAPQRRILRDHLAACEACREAAVARDASLVFARRLDESVPADEVADVLKAVRTGVAHIEAERRLRRPGRGRRAAAGAAAIALAALLAPAVSSRRETGAPVVSAGAGVRVTANAERAVPAAGLEPAAAETGASGSSATVYELNPGAGREEPRVVWIVDRGLDI
jgi:anti-sigma factor RsiW